MDGGSIQGVDRAGGSIQRVARSGESIQGVDRTGHVWTLFERTLTGC